MPNMLTEDQHIKLVEVGNKFWEELGTLAAECAAEFPPEIEDDVIMYLQDKCSIYGTNYDDKLREIRNDQHNSKYR